MSETSSNYSEINGELQPDQKINGNMTLNRKPSPEDGKIKSPLLVGGIFYHKTFMKVTLHVYTKCKKYRRKLPLKSEYT